MIESRGKKIFAWTLYDWANSAFALSVMAAFFQAFFKQYWSGGVEAAVSTARLGYGNAAAGILVGFSAPLLASIAGVKGNRKGFFAFFVVFGAFFTFLFYFIGSGMWLRALCVYVFARIGFHLANLFYDSMLKEISQERNMDMISSAGYGLGYLGCGLLFILHLILLNNPSLLGLSDKAEAVKVIFVSVSLWWIVFSIPLFLVKDNKKTDPGAGEKSVIADLKNTIETILKDRNILLFLIAYWFYIDGVHTVVMMSVDFGLSIGIELPGLLRALLVVQFVAFPFAFLFGYISERVGSKTTLIITVSGYVFITLMGGIFLNTARDFMFFAGLTGVFQGAIQALSRSFFSRITPSGYETEFFGIYNIVGRFSFVIGPFIIASANTLAHKIAPEFLSSSRIGIVSISILFLTGGVLLSKVQNRQ